MESRVTSHGLTVVLTDEDCHRPYGLTIGAESSSKKLSRTLKKLLPSSQICGLALVFITLAWIRYTFCGESEHTVNAVTASRAPFSRGWAR